MKYTISGGESVTISELRVKRLIAESFQYDVAKGVEVASVESIGEDGEWFITFEEKSA